MFKFKNWKNLQNTKIFHKKIVESVEICRNLRVEILDGMTQEYRENAAYERIIRKFMALAFLPIKDVRAGKCSI